MPRKRKRLRVWKATVKGHYVIRWQWVDETKPHQEATELTATKGNVSALRKLLVAKEKALLAERKTGVPWATVMDRYDKEELIHQKPRSRSKWVSATNKLKKHCAPCVLSDVNGSLLSQFGAKLREEGLAADTIAGYFAELRRTLRWAEDIWQNYSAPRVRPPKGVKRSGMKGRPITREEFERMLDATAGVVGADFAAGWRYYLTGLYLSGLRLEESLRFTWDDPREIHVLSLNLNRPRIQMPYQKSGRDDGLPLATDFAFFLSETPHEKRKGRVFRPELKRGTPSYWTFSDTVSDIGKAAKVLVFAGRDECKYASAHDLRRAFGTRWAPHVMPVDLQKLMRHRTIQTTMKYYVDLDLDSMSKRTRKAGDSFDAINAAKELLRYQPDPKHVT